MDADDYYVEDVDMVAAPAAPDQNADPTQLPPEAPEVSESNHPPTLAQEVPPRHLDDVERMICHEDFPALLAQAAKVKSMREAMDVDVAAPSSSTAPRSVMDPRQVIAAVTRMKNAHCNKGEDMPVVRRGTYPLTDSMLEESFDILHKELVRCEQWYEQRKQNDTAAKQTGSKRKAGSESIAVKYAKWQTDILMDWVIAHKDHPFPDSEQIKELGEKTGLTHSQVVNWTTNVRKRNLKATVEGGKKPHHFVDFVFLAHDRERREARGLSPAPSPAKKASSRRKKAKKVSKSKAPTDMAPPYALPSHTTATHDGEHDPAQSYHPHSAFRPYHDGGGYDPNYHQHPPHNGYHSQYQHPFPLPPYGHNYQSHPHPPQRKLGVVSESFDDDATEPITSMDEDNTDALTSFANFWDGDGVAESSPHANGYRAFIPKEPTSLVKQVDAIVAATLENDLMTQPIEKTPDPNRDSLSSLEMIDLDDSNCFLDDYDLAKNVTEI